MNCLVDLFQCSEASVVKQYVIVGDEQACEALPKQKLASYNSSFTWVVSRRLAFWLLAATSNCMKVASDCKRLLVLFTSLFTATTTRRLALIYGYEIFSV